MMNSKQEIIKGLIEELSNIEKQPDVRFVPQFKAWLTHVSLTLEAAGMENEFKIWEKSLKNNWRSPFENDLLSSFTIPYAQKKAAKDLLLAFLNNFSDDNKSSDSLFPMEIFQDTRDYLCRIAHQVNICYTNACYDACAVMLRRLIETLVIGCFEHHKIEAKIKNNQGNNKNLGDMIGIFINEATFNLSRNIKSSLPKLKDLGHQSAHNPYFTASRNDIDKLAQDIRVIIPELVEKSGVIKK